MAIIDRHINSSGLGPPTVGYLQPVLLGSYKASSVAGVYSKQTFASTINATVATGTQVDFPRNLHYNLVLTNSTGSSAMISGGTVVVDGYDVRGSTIRETINLASNALASLQSSAGSVLFARVESISFSNFSLATASSSASNSVSFSIGVGQIVALPFAAKSSHCVPNAWIGTIGQFSSVGIGASTASSTLSYSIQTGSIGIAGVWFSNALATNTPVFVHQYISR